ncbi:MAG TPA: hypothetical protein VNK04_03845, partial [Gemmataceae bacterium]|nr:hypothetical protein [Gemmataceae bacterium]
TTRPPAPPHPAPRPRKPPRQAPKPKLTQAALKGEAPLRTFSELSVFWEARSGAAKKTPSHSSTGGTDEAPPPA